MTVSSQNSKDGPYNCNGSQDTFPFSFKVFSKNDLSVVLTDITSDVESDLTVDSQFSVSLNADQNASPGGTITTLSIYPVGQKITIVRDVAATQQTAITNFRPAVFERALDKLTMLVQQTMEGLSRAVKVKVSSSGASPDDLISSIEASVNQAEAFAMDAAGSAGQAETFADNAGTSASDAQNSADAAQASAVAAANSASLFSSSVQHQLYTAFDSAGTAPTFTVATSPAYGAYAAKERLRIKFNGNVASGASSLNRDTLGAKALKQYDSSGSKVNPIIVADRPYDVEYDGTDYVILNPTLPVYSLPLDLVSGQIKFPATQNPSADPNTLDDYEEGTWTPTLADGTYSSNTGSYQKIGRAVNIWFELVVNAQTNANPVRVSTPFTSSMAMAVPCSLLSTEATAVRLALTGTGIYPRTSANADMTVTTFSGDTLSGSGSFLNSN